MIDSRVRTQRRGTIHSSNINVVSKLSMVFERAREQLAHTRVINTTEGVARGGRQEMEFDNALEL